jgi:undecaprenyl diphosphate synthase
MGLVKQYLRGELDFYRENRIRIRHAGDKEGLPKDIQNELDIACKETADFKGLQVILALNYGGRDEIVRAVKRRIQKGIPGPGGSNFPSITEDSITENMDNPDVPPPDLIIRTAGEFRTSNFLLWEGAYAEYSISDKLWPDWVSEDLIKAINEYQNRNRRFGGVSR